MLNFPSIETPATFNSKRLPDLQAQLSNKLEGGALIKCVMRKDDPGDCKPKQQ